MIRVPHMLDVDEKDDNDDDVDDKNYGEKEGGRGKGKTLKKTKEEKEKIIMLVKNKLKLLSLYYILGTIIYGFCRLHNLIFTRALWERNFNIPILEINLYLILS